jgi:hypothetical protein
MAGDASRVDDPGDLSVPCELRSDDVVSRYAKTNAEDAREDEQEMLQRR